MAGLNVGDIVEMTLRGRIAGQRTLSIFHYQTLTESTETETTPALTLLAEQFDSGTNNPTLAMLAAQSDDYVLESIRAQRLWPTRSIYVDVVSGLPGTRTGAVGLPNVAACITRRGPLAGRKYISTLHIPGVAAEESEDGEWMAGTLTRLELIATRLKLSWPLVGDAWEGRPIILNRPTPNLSLGIEATAVQATVRVMRRRTVGFGE